MFEPFDPFINVNPVATNLERHRGMLEQQRENRTRPASCFMKYSTAGQGELLTPRVCRFDVTFVEEPRVFSGWEMDGDTLVKGYYPMVSAGVWKWQRDARGYYLGAWLVFNITGHDTYTIDHHFHFTGIAIKDLPAHLLEE